MGGGSGWADALGVESKGNRSKLGSFRMVARWPLDWRGPVTAETGEGFVGPLTHAMLTEERLWLQTFRAATSFDGDSVVNSFIRAIKKRPDAGPPICRIKLISYGDDYITRVKGTG